MLYNTLRALAYQPTAGLTFTYDRAKGINTKSIQTIE